MPERLKPVETMPKARPAAPGGAALRTSMSRDGAITPPRNPAIAIMAVSSGDGSAIVAMISTIAALTAKQAGGELSVPPCAVGEIAAGQHANGAGGEIGGQRQMADENDAP